VQLKADQEVTLVLTRMEGAQLLGVLKHAAGMVNLLDPKPQTQNFLGKLIKKVAKGVGKVTKPALP